MQIRMVDLIPRATALDFLGHLIAFDPVDRPNAAEALAHPWLATYHDEEDEPVCQRKFDRWHAIEELETLEQYRDALVQEVYSCRREVRNLAGTPEGSRIPPIDEDIEATEGVDSPLIHDSLARVLTSESLEHRRPNASRKASMEPGTLHPSIPEGSVAFPGAGDPVVNYSRRSIFGHPSRTSSTYSIKQVASPSIGSQPLGADAPQQQTPQDKSTVAFPSTGEYVVPARHRAASMHTVGGESDVVGPAEVRRLLRTLSTLSVYETAEGKAGGLADVNPIGKYIVQNHRTGDEAVQSEMPREIMGTESSESPSPVDGHEKERRFTL